MTTADVEEDLSNVNHVTFTVNAANDGANEVVEVPNVEPEHNGDIPHEKVMTVTLKAGKNKVSITGAVGEGWLNVDYIDVCNAPIHITDTQKGTERLEAENFDNTGRFEGCDQYPEGYGVGGANTDTAFEDIAEDWSNIKYVDFTVYVPEAGNYQVTMGYDGENRSDMPLVYRVNGGENKKLTIDAAGWSNVQTSAFTVELQKGFNDLQISGTIETVSNWMNLDYIDITLVPNPIIEEGEVTIDSDRVNEMVSLPAKEDLVDAILTDAEKTAVDAGDMDIEISVIVEPKEISDASTDTEFRTVECSAQDR